MSSSAYQDFDLLLQPDGPVYRVRVVGSPVGGAAGIFRVPFTDQELEDFLVRAERPLARGEVGTGPADTRLIGPSPAAIASDEAAAKRFGVQLFQSLFTGEILECFRRSMDAAGKVRVRLRLTDVPELIRLPWEYLYDEPRGRFLSLDARSPVVRYLDLPDPVAPLGVQPPLRILAMVSSPKGHAALDVEREWRNLRHALGDLEQSGAVVLERVDGSTLSALHRRLATRAAPCHVFHFIGHGDFDHHRGEGGLLVEGEDGLGRLVPAADIALRLRNHESIRLAVLNSCRGAVSAAKDAFGGAAQKLLQQGIPAVVAMQFPITDLSAIELSHEFYRVLADGQPVDRSLMEARSLLSAKGSGLEWGTPVLYLRAKDGVLFEVDPAHRPTTSSAPPTTTLPPLPPTPHDALEGQSRFYVHRPADRHLEHVNKTQGMTVTIKGPRHVGKNSLLNRLLVAAHDGGKAIAHIDFLEFDRDTVRDKQAFFECFCHSVSGALRVDPPAEGAFAPGRLSPMQRCGQYFESKVLAGTVPPAVLALDNVQHLFDADHCADFFGMLRSWHEKRGTQKQWRRFDLILVTAMEPNEFVKDQKQSPFNVGAQIDLDDFTPEQADELNRRYGSPLGVEEMRRLAELTRGHPLLTHCVIYHVASKQGSPAEALGGASEDGTVFGRHLSRLAARVEREGLKADFLRATQAEQCAQGTFNRLRAAGLVRREGGRVLPRCRLYGLELTRWLHG